MANPILAKTTRVSLVENIHRGAFCLIDSKKDIKFALGDVSSPIFPHSSIKSIQALALFKSGAVEKFTLDEKDIAIACASHDGEKLHVEAVKRFLDKINCTIDDLECGSHLPVSKKARKEFFASGYPLSSIYNACSGKHAGMMAVAKALGVEVKGYSKRDHKAQKLVRHCIEEVIGQNLSDEYCGIDGCSVPTFAAPLSDFAFGFAKMATGQGLDKHTAKEIRQIFDANMNKADLIRGAGSLDSELMRVFDGRLLVKYGSDGIYCGALIDDGFGFALKIDDGNLQAAEIAIASLLLNFAKPNEKQRKILETYSSIILRNWQKIIVAKMTSPDWD